MILRFRVIGHDSRLVLRSHHQDPTHSWLYCVGGATVGYVDRLLRVAILFLSKRAPRYASAPRLALSFGCAPFRVLVIVANAIGHLGALKVFCLPSCLALRYSTSGSKLRVSVASLLGPEV